MIDPYRVLGVSAQADDVSVRTAYLSAIRACPPERDAVRFERIRSAYEAISDARRRRMHALFDVSDAMPSDLVHAVMGDAKLGRPSVAAVHKLLGGL